MDDRSKNLVARFTEKNNRLRTLADQGALPKEFYHEDKHDEIKEQQSTKYKQESTVDIKIDGLVQLSKTVSGGIKCEHCGIDHPDRSSAVNRASEHNA